MKHLNFYTTKKLQNEQEVFDYFLKNLQHTIATWSYFVDWQKIKTNVKKIEIELNILNSLIGKKDITNEFLKVIKEYPKTKEALPILIAVRKQKLKEMPVLFFKHKLLTAERKDKFFDPKLNLDPNSERELENFFNDSGLKDIFEDKTIKNLVDYCLGVEVGLDSNARKNRTGTEMENILELYLKKFCEQNKLKYIPQATQAKISQKLNYNLKVDKINRRFDFALLINTKLFLFETNFYGGSGTKLKSTAGEYKVLHDFLKKQNATLVWVTDGIGWRSSKKALEETFYNNDYVFNIKMLSENILEELI